MWAADRAPRGPDRADRTEPNKFIYETNLGPGRTRPGLKRLYADGSTQSFSLSAPDWHGGCSQTGAAVALYTPYRNGSGGKSSLDVCVYAASVPLTSGQAISYVVLPDVGSGVRPDVPAMHVFAAAVQ